MTDQSARNSVAGTWRMTDAYAEVDGDRVPLYGGRADGLLVFTEDLRFVEVLRDTGIAPFAAAERENGTAEENAAAVAGALGQYGTYALDEEGAFAGNTIVGSTFPNWNDLARTTDQLRMVVDGDTLSEQLTDPGAPPVTIVYARVG